MRRFKYQRDTTRSFGDPPAWVAESIFYQIFPDRFASSRKIFKPRRLEKWYDPPTRLGFKGGDLLGVVEHLDHLEELGINAIYLNPIFSSASNHRYHTYDYFKVDPLLGGDRAFDEFLRSAHARGIRVVLDGVFNHCGRGFWPFHHLMENGAQSPYRDWFLVKRWPLRAYARSGKPNYEAWWGLKPLPKLNVANSDTREYLLRVAEYWVERGIDGWRLDVPEEIKDVSFWREFRKRVRAVNPEAYLVGEIWREAPEWLEGDRFDALMNYPFNRTALGFCAGDRLRSRQRHGSWTLRCLSARRALQQLVHQQGCYRPEVVRSQLNLVGSHDTPRFLTLAGGDHSAVHLATLLQMTLPGAPCICYGDEVGVEGGPDPDTRRGFPWNKRRWHKPTWRLFRRAVALRRSQPLLVSGSFHPLGSRAGVLAFLRTPTRPRSGALVVALNAGREAANVSFRLPEEVAGKRGDAVASAVDLWDLEAASPDLQRGTGSVRLKFAIAARSGRVLALK